MRAAAVDLEFERAARLRDDIEAMTRAMERSAVVFGDGTDADVFSVAEDELEMAVQVFHVRGGRIRGQRGWVAEKEHEDVPKLIEHLSWCRCMPVSPPTASRARSSSRCCRRTRSRDRPG